MWTPYFTLLSSVAHSICPIHRSLLDVILIKISGSVITMMALNISEAGFMWDVLIHTGAALCLVFVCRLHDGSLFLRCEDRLSITEVPITRAYDTCARVLSDRAMEFFFSQSSSFRSLLRVVDKDIVHGPALYCNAFKFPINLNWAWTNWKADKNNLKDNSSREPDLFANCLI